MMLDFLAYGFDAKLDYKDRLLKTPFFSRKARRQI